MRRKVQGVEYRTQSVDTKYCGARRHMGDKNFGDKRVESKLWGAKILKAQNLWTQNIVYKVRGA